MTAEEDLAQLVFLAKSAKKKRKRKMSRDKSCCFVVVCLHPLQLWVKQKTRDDSNTAVS